MLEQAKHIQDNNPRSSDYKLNKGKMKIVKYNKKTKEIKCECGGDVWVDGKGHYELPVGLGDIGKGRFGVNKIRFSGWIGQCEKCKEQVIAWETKKIITREIGKVCV